MDENKKKQSLIKAAAITAIIGNGILAALKIGAGIIANSSALLSDGLDSSSDVLISVITLAIVRVMSKPADAEHPWGHGRAETVATVALSFILCFMGAQLTMNAVTKLFSGGESAVPNFSALIVTIVSIAGKGVLAWSQYLFGKRAGSQMLRANAKNMLGDVVMSAGVLVGLVLSSLTGSSLADTILSALIGLWIIWNAIGIFKEANLELMDGSSDTEHYMVILEAAASVEGAYEPHRARMRRVAGLWDIDFDIYVDPDCTVHEAHEIASRVEQEIKGRLDNVLDIMIHVEPKGDDKAESYGLSEGIIRRKQG